MAADERSPPPGIHDALKEIQSTLHSIRQDYRGLASSLEALEARINVLAGVNEPGAADQTNNGAQSVLSAPIEHRDTQTLAVGQESGRDATVERTSSSSPRTASSRIILTTYPGQAGIDPVRVNWGHHDQILRGPVVVSRSQSTLRRRNGMAKVFYPMLVFSRRPMVQVHSSQSSGFMLICAM